VARFCALQAEIAATHVTGMPDLVTMRADEVGRSGLPTGAVAELSAALAGLDDGTRSLCHFDLHPRNILVQGDRWVVIDWLTAASGPAIADVARTVLICGGGDPTERAFGSAVERRYHEEREAAASEIAAWVRVLAAARLSEGFTGAAADRLRTVALGGSVGR
jgi:Ser/Thr protein kinase RdoA (MazF antagonist)